MKFERYGQTWYTTRLEMEATKQPGETIWFDSGLNAYCIKEKRKSIWDF